MRWHSFFYFALWGTVFVNGRSFLRPEPTLAATEEPLTTLDPTTIIDLTSTSEPDLPIIRTASKRVLRSVTVYDENEIVPDQPTVTIAQGTVVGSVADDGDYIAFYGIPYADSTSGVNRFKAPLPPPTFQDTFVADRKDIKCVRALGVGYEGTEDCLVANILTPSLNRTSELPVMVWIKGREFDEVIDHNLSFKNFVEQDVIVVSLNYRESILGFLCLGTEAAPGNAGLKDIIAGLRWVKENIALFGGNPNDITLFGHGSGAAAVDLVTLSPMADGLVHKAITQSGNAMAPWAVSRDNLKYAVEVAEALGHQVTNVDELSHIFERTSVPALMAVINELDLTENSLAFAPCIEREELEGVQPFLVKTPYEILSNGDFLQIPFITGFVENEGTIRAREALEGGWLEKMDENFSNFLQSDLRFDSDGEKALVSQQIRQFYFEDNRIDLSTLDNYIKYHGETMMLVSSIREVRIRAQISSTPTYLYVFSYKGELGESFVGPLDVQTAAHSEELAYMFHGATEEVSDWDLTVAEILIERWTNFAKTGDPTSNISGITWRPFTSDDQSYLRVLSSSEVSNTMDSTLEVDLINPYQDTMSFWNEIYEEHFLDAESNWDLSERNEDDDLIEGSGEENNEGEGTEEENEDNSASTTVGYTFMIITLFTILNKFHVSQLIS